MSASVSSREQQVLDRIERARNRRAKVKEERITKANVDQFAAQCSKA